MAPLCPSPKPHSHTLSDQAGRRITLLGSIASSPALLTVERAAFPSDPETLRAFHSAIANVKNLGDNDIYKWYLACSGTTGDAAADLKLNLIYPCTEQHIKKYSPQGVRMVTETPEIYKDYIRPHMQRNRDAGRLDWVFNVLDGRAEQEDVILRDSSIGPEGGFLVAPDLNWDRKTVTSLHVLGLVERRDLWSLRDLKKTHVEWLKRMREKMLDAVVGVYGEKGVERDMLKLYMHCASRILSNPATSLRGCADASTLQINRPITTSTSTSSTPNSKPVARNPPAKPSGSKTSSPSSKPWPGAPKPGWRT